MTDRAKRSPNFDALQKEYGELLAGAERLSRELPLQIDSALRDSDLKVALPIQARVKTWDSIHEKAHRNESFPERLSELQDFVGVRLVFLFERDAKTAVELLSRTLAIARSYDTKDRLGPETFGYLSHHCVGRVPARWLELPTFAGLGAMQFEIQVRSLAQHLWAEVSHRLQYKVEADVPRSLRRDLNRVSAVLEIVDFECERLLESRDTYRGTLKASATAAALDVDLIETTLSTLWPPQHKLPSEPYAMLPDLLREVGCLTQADLSSLINRHRETVLIKAGREAERLRNLAEAYGVVDGRIDANTGTRHIIMDISSETLERAKAGIFYGHAALTFNAIQFEKGELSSTDPGF